MGNSSLVLLIVTFWLTFSRLISHSDDTMNEIAKSNNNLETCRTNIKTMPIPLLSELSLDAETIDNEKINLISMFLYIRFFLLKKLSAKTTDIGARNSDIAVINFYYHRLIGPCTMNDLKITYEKLFNKSIVLNNLNIIYLLKGYSCSFIDAILETIMQKNQTNISAQEKCANRNLILTIKASAFIFKKHMFLNSHTALLILNIQKTATQSYKNYSRFSSKIKYLIHQELTENYQDKDYITLLIRISNDLWFQYAVDDLPMLNTTRNSLPAFLCFIKQTVHKNQDSKIFTLKTIKSIFYHLAVFWYEIKVYEEAMNYVITAYDRKFIDTIALKCSCMLLATFMDNIEQLILNIDITPDIKSHLTIFTKLLSSIYCDENNCSNYNQYINYMRLVNLYSLIISKDEYEHSIVIKETSNVCSVLIGLFFHALNENYEAIGCSIEKIVKYSWNMYFGNEDKSLSVKSAIENSFRFQNIDSTSL